MGTGKRTVKALKIPASKPMPGSDTLYERIAKRNVGHLKQSMGSGLRAELLVRNMEVCS